MGSKGEEIAARFLQQQGYSIIEKNYRTKFGEIDIIGRDGETIVFIEVKLRSGKSFGVPLEAVDQRKRFQVGRVARYYLSQKRMDKVLCRFDTVSILLLKRGNFQCDLIKDAFRLDGEQ